MSELDAWKMRTWFFSLSSFTAFSKFKTPMTLELAVSVGFRKDLATEDSPRDYRSRRAQRLVSIEKDPSTSLHQQFYA
jgi:hypothetical protein